MYEDEYDFETVPMTPDATREIEDEKEWKEAFKQ
jgi:hypothetical protein